MTKSEAESLILMHGGQQKAADAAGVSRHVIRRALLRSDKPVKGANESTKVTASKSRSVSQFREEYDKSFYIPKKIDAALKELGSGWLYESEFCKLAGVSPTDLSAFRDQYSDRIVQLKEGRRAWAGRPSVAKEMREML